MQKKSELIDFLKGIAITGIILRHIMMKYITVYPDTAIYSLAIKAFSILASGGNRIFFFCSGFGLYLSFLKHHDTFRSFLKRRLSKVYLPYIVIVLITFIMPFKVTQNDGIGALLSHIFLYKMFIPQYESTFGVFWFISTIFQFYILFYPLCALKKKIGSNKWFVIACILIGLFWQTVMYMIFGMNYVRVLNGSAIQYLPVFAIGMVSAELFFEGKYYDLNIWKTFFIALAGLAIDGAMVLGPVKPLIMFNDLPDFIGYLFILIFVWQLNINWVRKGFLSISRISYEWYLIHILVLEILFRSFNVDTFAGQCVLGLVGGLISLGAAYGYNRIWKVLFANPPLSIITNR